jgi:hypothetical protein
MDFQGQKRAAWSVYLNVKGLATVQGKEVELVASVE